MKREGNGRVRRIGDVGALGLLMAAGAAWGQVEFRTVVMSGDRAPGTPEGVVFKSDSFGGSFALAQSGAVGLIGNLTGGGVTSGTDTGIWTEVDGVLSLVAREGDAAPGAGAGVAFDWFQGIGLNSSGRVGVRCRVRGASVTTANDFGVWTNRSGVMEMVAREGEPAPGTEPGVVFDIVLYSAGQIGGTGSVAFNAFVKGPGVPSLSQAGLWINDADGSSLVFRMGDQAPGYEEGVVFGGMCFGCEHLNDRGDLVTMVTVQGPGVDGEVNGCGIWSNRTGSFETVVRAGTQAPGMAEGTVFTWFMQPMWNEVSRVAFRGDVLDAGVPLGHTGLWAERNGVFSLVAHSGAPAPGMAPGVVLSAMPSTAFGFSNVGQLAFVTLVQGPGVTPFLDDTCLFTEGGGVLRLLAREMGAVPEMPAGVYYSNFGATPINRFGQTAFHAGLGPTPVAAILVAPSNGGPKPIVWEGGSFDVNDDPEATDFRTVSGLSQSFGFNDAGELVFGAGFTDGTAGLFVATVPPDPPCPGDVNGDDRTNAVDFVILASHFGMSVSPYTEGDLTGDGVVDALDFVTLSADFGCKE